MYKVCVFTGTRAEYGILKDLLRSLDDDPEINLALLVSGSHLSPEHGYTIDEIKQDGLPIASKVKILQQGDNVNATLHSLAAGIDGYPEALDKIKPDFCLVLGDRYEALAFAVCCNFKGIPLGHLHGGELTLGAIDDAIRHSITKFAQLHFTSTKAYRQRVIQLGEKPRRVINCGALGAENISNEDLLDAGALGKQLGMNLSLDTLVITHHPVTLHGDDENVDELDALFTALEQFPACNLLFTLANADFGGEEINRRVKEFCHRHNNAYYFASLGRQKYFSLLQCARAVVGNSSSGIIEAPSFCIPTVNIGTRQDGRAYAASVIHCKANSKAIESAINKALSDKYSRAGLKKLKNPYYKKNTRNIIIEGIKKFLDGNPGTKKSFHDLKGS